MFKLKKKKLHLSIILYSIIDIENKQNGYKYDIYL